ncbi:MAG TPA: hypothetical protein QKA08_02485 [Candidatus Megaira endosymbiont of Nemacystus decipiens]|nr:hypothetical protein [Candidatus Megaera endosymbiont of Nemacystus decipiens]
MKNKKSQDIQKQIDGYKRRSQKKPSVICESNIAFNIAVEIVAGVLVGMIVGSLFDYLFDSWPISVILCVMLSCLASFKLIFNKYVRK